jgi:hypothetical protein
MPPQIKRLTLVFAVFFLLFLTARYFLVPESFGEYGHYRGLALGENLEKTPGYAGQKACEDCHSDITELKAGNVHASLSCETCHGPGTEHINSTDSVIPMQVPRTREFCALCHAKNAARKAGNVVQVDIAVHNPDQKCIECHNPHNPWEQIK